MRVNAPHMYSIPSMINGPHSVSSKQLNWLYSASVKTVRLLCDDNANCLRFNWTMGFRLEWMVGRKVTRYNDFDAQNLIHQISIYGYRIVIYVPRTHISNRERAYDKILYLYDGLEWDCWSKRLFSFYTAENNVKLIENRWIPRPNQSKHRNYTRNGKKT